MILTNIGDCGRYEGTHPLFHKVFEFLKNTDLASLPTGRTDIEGDILYVNHVVKGAEQDARMPMEVHRKYVDVHFLIDGRERFGYSASRDAIVDPGTLKYDEQCDCSLIDKSPDNVLALSPGDIVIVWPEDAHCAGIPSGGGLNKVIVKVKI